MPGVPGRSGAVSGAYYTVQIRDALTAAQTQIGALKIELSKLKKENDRLRRTLAMRRYTRRETGPHA